MGQSSLVEQRQLKIPVKLIARLRGQLRIKLNTGHISEIAEYLRHYYGEGGLENDNPSLYYHCTSAPIQPSDKTVNRAIGEKADRSKFELLDLICYVSWKKNLIEILFPEFENAKLKKQDIAYLTEIPDYAFEQLTNFDRGSDKTDVPIVETQETQKRDKESSDSDIQAGDINLKKNVPAEKSLFEKENPDNFFDQKDDEQITLSEEEEQHGEHKVNTEEEKEPLVKHPKPASFFKKYKFYFVGGGLLVLFLAGSLVWNINRDGKKGEYNSRTKDLTDTSKTNKATSSDSVRTPRTFRTISINGIEWMTENLRVDHYADGSPIPQAHNFSEWRRYCLDSVGCWCNYEFDNSNDTVFGKLYNWYAVSNSKNGGIAPPGFRIPLLSEFRGIFENDSEEHHTYGKFLASNGWSAGNNHTGFSALPSGRLSGSRDTFYDIREKACWWAKNLGSERLSEISVSPEGLTSCFVGKEPGLAVRCIKIDSSITDKGQNQGANRKHPAENKGERYKAPDPTNLMNLWPEKGKK